MLGLSVQSKFGKPKTVKLEAHASVPKNGLGFHGLAPLTCASILSSFLWSIGCPLC